MLKQDFNKMINRARLQQNSGTISCPSRLLRIQLFCLVVFASNAMASVAQESKRSVPVDQAAAVYAGDRLLKIDVQMDAGDWKALRISHRIADPEKIAEDPYLYYRADVEIDGVKFPSVGVRKKGFFGSVVSTRPSLKIRFDEWQEGRFFHGLDQLTLNNNVQDPSQMHQYLAYWLFQRAGAHSPRCNFAVVTVNGENLGVYSNVESIRDQFLNRVFNDSNGKLYEGYAGDIVDSDVEFSRLVRKNGKPKSGRKVLVQLRKALQESADLGELEAVLDFDAFVTHWASEVLMGHWDSYSGNRNNYYLYRDQSSKKFFFIPWGADSIFVDPGPFIQHPVPRSVKAVGAVCRRLWQDPVFRIRYEKEMRRLLDEVWIETEIYAEVKRIQTMLKPYITAKPDAVNASLDTANAFIKSRRKTILDEMENTLPEWPVPEHSIPGEVAPSVMMKISGSFETTMSDKVPRNPFDSGKAELNVSIDGKQQDLFTQVGVFANPEQAGFIRPDYPVIYMIAKGREGQKPWSLQFIIDPVRMVDEKPSLSVDHFCVWAMLVKGNVDSAESERRFFGVVGTLELDHFDTKPGGIISGTFEIQTQAFQK